MDSAGPAGGAGDLKVPPGVFEPLAGQLVADGYLSETLGRYRFTPVGLEMFQRFVGAFRLWILDRPGPVPDHRQARRSRAGVIRGYDEIHSFPMALWGAAGSCAAGARSREDQR